MRNRTDELSTSFLGPAEARVEQNPESEHSVLLIVAARMQGESLRYQLVSQGFEVDLLRSVSAALDRLAGASYDAVVVDWQTLEVEYPGASRMETWLRLAGEVCGSAAPVPAGLVALIESMHTAP